MDPKALGHEDAARAVRKSGGFSLIDRFRGFGEWLEVGVNNPLFYFGIRGKREVAGVRSWVGGIP